MPFTEFGRGLEMGGALGDWPAVYGLLRNVWDRPSVRRWLYGPRLLDEDLPDALDSLRAHWPQAESPLQAMLRFEWREKMVNDLLWQEDRASMAAGLEVRVPMVDAYVRAKDPRVRQVTASLSGNWQAVQILRGDGHRVADIRPLVRLNVSVVVEENGRMESGGHGAGGRTNYEFYLKPSTWKAAADEALRQALVNLSSVPAPAGEMQVVLGP